LEAALQTGMAAALCRRSTHLGALAPLLYIAANEGFAAIFNTNTNTNTNTSPTMASEGGKMAVLGNMPFGIAIPDPGGVSVILEMALSIAARSKVRRAAAAGEPIPEIWATDADGHSTADAIKAM
jgi:LDH2 family malate/lactate/ureidoglycolate dehydrogenase